jgi:hypothetical protein
MDVSYEAQCRARPQLTSANAPLSGPLRCYPREIGNQARMAELVDAPASGAGARKGVEVRVLFRAPVWGNNQLDPRRLTSVGLAKCGHT